MVLRVPDQGATGQGEHRVQWRMEERYLYIRRLLTQVISLFNLSSNLKPSFGLGESDREVAIWLAQID